MSENATRPSPLRLFMVMLYDCLLLLSALMLATVIPVVFNRGEAIEHGNPFFMVYLVTVCLLFYGWFWTHGGQTLGMRAWKVYLVGLNTIEVSWRQAVLRLFFASISWLCLGLGYLPMWLGQSKLSWHDQLSATQLVLHKKEKTKV